MPNSSHNHAPAIVYYVNNLPYATTGRVGIKIARFSVDLGKLRGLKRRPDNERQATLQSDFYERWPGLRDLRP